MKHVTIIATSLDEESKSQILATFFETHLNKEGVSCERIDLRKLNLPMAGASGSWSSPDTAALKQAAERASHIVFAVPIYCYDVNAVAKNVIELIGRSLTQKVVGFICSAGGANSYMSVMGFANHLMLDFRSIIVPRFLYVNSKTSWQNDGSLNPDVEERLKRLLEDLREVQVVTSNPGD